MNALRRCRRHGFYSGERCPDCGGSDPSLLDGDRRRRLSRFLSGALRHFPGDVGLSIDGAGWVTRRALARTVTERYDWALADHVDAVVATDPKDRFEVASGDPRVELDDEARIRAAYGHSIDVTIDGDRGAVDLPRTLYHGTTPDSAAAIEREGLRPMGRQTVHLSGTVGTARAVGRRRCPDPVVFTVDVRALTDGGIDVYRRGTETYTTARVPPEYLSRLTA